MKRFIGSMAWCFLGIAIERTAHLWGANFTTSLVPWAIFFGACAVWAVLDLRDEADMTRNRGTWL